MSEILARLDMQIEIKEKADYNISSVLQGVMMEKIEPEYAGKLHDTAVNPYSMVFYKEGDRYIWRINTFNNEAKEKIIDVFMNPTVKDFTIKHRNNETVKILEKTLKMITYDDLVEKYYLTDSKRYININFKTPASFKSNGKYMIYPTTRTIFQSLINKFGAYSDKISLDVNDLLENFENYSEITDYRMRSTRFHLEGVTIPSFIGEVTIKITGPQMMVNLANMLAAFGEYAGIGIKTSIGMGAVEINRERRGVKNA
ncbi:MAG: CRISPR-associated endoribonuclease Cas6 [Lachnospiraceae bacterium]|nr:CRISPR-associated endoribonuclease Cas6 [Lachnospiraceae bacterium]MEE0959210.1 CRISPR-associated endoribonuclease Cas6 [Lachnospiraceae bacterium]